jgi:putative chitinase
MNKTIFFANIRKSLYRDKLPQQAVDGCNVILDAAVEYISGTKHALLRRQWLAYILATAYHETAYTMQPIREFGKGKGKRYGVPVPPYDQVYYGRGYVQLTWIDNYRKAGDLLSSEFVKNPDLVMQPKHAVAILFRGMIEGWFAKGQTLERYINENECDYVGARRIINGTDKAKLIAGYAAAFEKALERASNEIMTGEDKELAKPTGKTAIQSTTNIAATVTGVSAAIPVLSEVSNQINAALVAGRGLSSALVEIAEKPLFWLSLLAVGAAGYIIRERMKKSREEGI